MARPRPIALIVMDGWGYNPRSDGNAIALANTPNIRAIERILPHTLLQASGKSVGLPDGQMGNSEVGHLNIGAGHKVVQDFTRISDAIDDGSFFTNEALLAAIGHVKKNNSSLHVCGLLGPGGVHAHESHLEACLKLAAQHNADRVFIHAFTDGRDTPPKSGVEYMKNLLTAAEAINPEHPAKVATITGRLWAMDRDNRWERTAKAYFAMTRGEGASCLDPIAGIAASYDAGITDEFIEPIVTRTAYGEPVATVKDGDAVIFYNYRADRARQLTKAFILPELSPQAQSVFPRGALLNDLYFVTMTEYESGLPAHIAFAGDDVQFPLARVFSDIGMKQYHTAETEKYAHVTYFINGGRETPFPGEDRYMEPSPKVKTYDLQPEMSAAQLTDKALERIRSQDYDVIIMNFANADMVGHTGVLAAAMKAVETVDTQVGRITETVLAMNGAVIITADHGNADQMIDYHTGGPFTAHTTNPVPFYVIAKDFAHAHLRSQGILADIAPTLLQIVGIPAPAAMTGQSLIENTNLR